jgi:hypothetical protein
MTKNRKDADKDEQDRLIEREARAGMHLSMEQAIFLSGAGGLMKGGTPVAPYEQALHQIMVFLDRELQDALMEKALNDWINFHRHRLEKRLKNPIQGLLDIIDHTLAHEGALVEFVRTVDVHYGQVMKERPYFQHPGEPPHPEDPYTFETVRQSLNKLAAACRERLRE